MKPIDEADVRQRLERDGKIQTIHFVMQEAEVCLSEAKQYVDSLLEQDNTSAQAEIPSQNSAQPDEGKVRSFLVRGEKLQAIQFVREQTGMGLYEAKNYVEALAPQIEGVEQWLAGDVTPPVKARRGGKGLFIAVVFIVFILGISLLINLDKLF